MICINEVCAGVVFFPILTHVMLFYTMWNGCCPGIVAGPALGYAMPFAAAAFFSASFFFFCTNVPFRPVKYFKVSALRWPGSDDDFTARIICLT